MKLRMQPLHRLPGDHAFGRLGRLTALALLGLSLAIGLDTLAWLRLERRLDRDLAAFVARARAAGWHVEADSSRRGGWPLVATLTLVRPSLRSSVPGPVGEAGWSGERLMLTLSPLHPHRPTLLALGTQSLSWGPALPAPTRVRVWGARIALALPPDEGPGGSGATGSLVLQADALHLAASGAGPDDIAQVAGATARLAWQLPGQLHATEGGDTIALSLQLRDVALPVRLGGSAGRVVQRARLEARLTGRVARALLPAGQRLSLWQGSGGQLRVDEASIDWGSSKAALAGAAWLAADRAAEGHFDLALTEPGPALHQLQQAGQIGPGVATAVDAVVGLVAAGGAAGVPLHLPLSLRRGVLSLGEIPLLRLTPPER